MGENRLFAFIIHGGVEGNQPDDSGAFPCEVNGLDLLAVVGHEPLDVVFDKRGPSCWAPYCVLIGPTSNSVKQNHAALRRRECLRSMWPTCIKPSPL